MTVIRDDRRSEQHPRAPDPRASAEVVPRPADPAPLPPARAVVGIRSARGLEAWMLVLPVDGLALLTPLLWAPQHAKAWLLMALLSMTLLTGGGRYRARLHVSVLDDLPTLVSRLLTGAAVVATVFALVSQQEEVMGFLVGALAAIGMVILGRIVTAQVLLLGRRRRVVAHPTVLIGGGPAAAEMAELLRRYPQYGLTPIGYLDDRGPHPASRDTPWLGALDRLDGAIRAGGADVILVADGNVSEDTLLEVVRTPTASSCDLLIVPRLRQFRTLDGFGDHIGSVPVMRIRNPALRGPAWAVKRALDVVVSGVALVALSPVLLVCAVAVRLEGGRGVLFRQERVGRHGQTFSIVKFRSMRPATGAESATRWSIASDTRVGPVGRALRRTSLDELPQLWSIFRGEMTLVGPRPERPHFVDQFSVEIDRYQHRHRVRAGLTGLAQVSGLRGDTPISDRARFDNYYIENWSLWLDVKVVLRTFGEILFARGR